MTIVATGPFRIERRSSKTTRSIMFAVGLILIATVNAVLFLTNFWPLAIVMFTGEIVILFAYEININSLHREIFAIMQGR